MSPILSTVMSLFPNFFTTVPQGVLLEVPGSFWLPFASLFAHFGFTFGSILIIMLKFRSKIHLLRYPNPKSTSR